MPPNECDKWIGIEVIYMVEETEISPEGSTGGSSRCLDQQENILNMSNSHRHNHRMRLNPHPIHLRDASLELALLPVHLWPASAD